MSSWVEDEARAEAMLYRDGPELWRDLKASIKKAVEDYTRIYSPPGTVEIECGNCPRADEDCILVRSTTGISCKIYFSREDHKIVRAEDHLELSLAINDGEITIRGPKGELESLEDASKTILKPLFSRLARRRPNIAP